MDPVPVEYTEDPRELRRRHWQAHLRIYRISRGLSQRELADEIGIPRGTWSCWECGARIPGGKYPMVLVRKLGIPPPMVQTPKKATDSGVVLRTFEDVGIEMPF